MSYFGGNERLGRKQLNDYDPTMNSSFSNLKEFDKSINDNENEYGHNDDSGDLGNEGGTGLIEKNEMKELEIYDPSKKENIDFIPVIIKVNEKKRFPMF